MKIKPFGLNAAAETRHATSLQCRGGRFNNRNYKQMKKQYGSPKNSPYRGFTWYPTDKNSGIKSFSSVYIFNFFFLRGCPKSLLCLQKHGKGKETLIHKSSLPCN
jgi:hypothetical protein